MIKTIKNISIFFAVACAAVFSACEDNIRYGEEIGEGTARIEGTVQFKNFTPALSRANGNSLDALNNLSVIIYNEAGTQLIENIYLSGNSLINQGGNTDAPEGATDPDLSSPTNKRSFNINLEYGKYKIYAVANAGRLTDAQVNTEAALKSLRFNWDSNDISKNAQMFGWFTENGAGSSANNVTNSEDFNAPVITINRSGMQLTAWLVRLASKVTVAFDGRGLRSGVQVYIHDVSIRQIPLSCALGEVNHPTEEDQITPDRYDAPEENATQVLCYDSKGYTAQQTTYDVEQYRNWLVINNGTEVLGSANHSSSDPALFFYENAQGDYSEDPNKAWYDKNMKKDSVGENIEPGMNDYRDNVKCGTFIEVQAYYRRTSYPITYGAIRYRFMLGQDTDYNYNALRNYHYKVTLGFKGDANNPDWHIEYREPDHVIFANEVYVPYTYNTYVDYPITITGSDLRALEAEIIENNWGPYLEGDPNEVPAEAPGGTKADYNNRTLPLIWWRDLCINGSNYSAGTGKEYNNLYNKNVNLTNSESNYLYGRHLAYDQDGRTLYHLTEQGESTGVRYVTTPIWAGFLRLQQPESYTEDADVIKIPAYLQRNLAASSTYGGSGADQTKVLNSFRDFYFGRNTVYEYTDKEGHTYTEEEQSDFANTTNLSKRTYQVLDPSDPDEKIFDEGKCNQYTIIRTKDNHGNTVANTIILRLWTQPKSMCGVSGFSGNNPYEDYLRKAVIRFRAKFDDEEVEVVRDVEVFQARRMINPKAVWRSSDNDKPFDVTLYQRDINNRSQFTALQSQGAWSARVTQGDPSLVKLVTIPGTTNATASESSIIGRDNTNISFRIEFPGATRAGSRFAIVEVRYHNNSCVHNIYVRRGYDEPVQLVQGGPYWASFNLFSCQNTTANPMNATFTASPLAFGGMFKRGNLTQAISVSNISKPGLGPLDPPGSTTFSFNAYNGTAPGSSAWGGITGNTNASYTWPTFTIGGVGYRMPTVDEYKTLIDGDFGIGVLYGDGATKPATTTADAFGFTNGDNTNTPSSQGMRGFVCYDPDVNSADHIFFPIGTMGLGRRTVQILQGTTYRGQLRYGSTWYNLNATEGQSASARLANSCRPIPVNMANAPGAIYWLQDDRQYYGWDMNFFDLNFNGSDQGTVLATGTTSGTGGDALPIRLVRN